MSTLRKPALPESDWAPGMRHQPLAGAEEAGEEKEYIVKFGQIYLSTPVVAESDGDTKTLYPREARLRNLT